MPGFLYELLRALTLQEGTFSELFSSRRKYHLLQKEWYDSLPQSDEMGAQAWPLVDIVRLLADEPAY
ncbi:MAG: hypothetical protein N2441_03630 [Rhodocyclaceae bacterium]|nr:hypothetical protein [Rhodocyclaceae bacterium]